jgi:hypothetical protein
MEMPDREVSIAISEQFAHPANLGRVGAARRSFPKPPIAQSIVTLFVKPDAQAAELAPRHAKQFASLIST